MRRSSCGVDEPKKSVLLVLAGAGGLYQRPERSRGPARHGLPLPEPLGEDVGQLRANGRLGYDQPLEVVGAEP
jgi:hypothetical protein